MRTGQHSAGFLPALLGEFEAKDADLMVGSRYVLTGRYEGEPLDRRVGMRAFCLPTRLLGGRRIYDTTSGMRAVRRTVFLPLTRWHFVDFHAETIVYLLRLGYSVNEVPIEVGRRSHRRSM